MLDDDAIARMTAHYPPADLSAAEFEEFVVELLRSVAPAVGDVDVRLHDKIAAADGTYDFDATVRFEFAGLQFLVIVEAKKHAHPIKRELVQVLHQKVQSVGAHKGVMISTAPYQSGAVAFAKIHGVALATVTEGRFTFEARGTDEVPPMSREEAFTRYGVPTFVGHYYGAGSTPDSTSVTLLSPERPEFVLEMLTGLQAPQA